jgi:hypothetical protein
MCQVLRGATLQASAIADNSVFSSEPMNSMPVRLIGLPSAPTLISTQETLDGNINISWKAPSDTGYSSEALDPLTMYRIDASLCAVETCKTKSKYILSTDADFWHQTTLLKSDVLSETACTYSFTILTRNAIGWSQASNTVQQDYK